MDRNFTPPAWLPKQVYGCSRWYIATFRDGSQGYARHESISGRDRLTVYGHFGSRYYVDEESVTLYPEYYTVTDWTADAAERGLVTFSK